MLPDYGTGDNAGGGGLFLKKMKIYRGSTNVTKHLLGVAVCRHVGLVVDMIIQ